MRLKERVPQLDSGFHKSSEFGREWDGFSIFAEGLILHNDGSQTTPEVQNLAHAQTFCRGVLVGSDLLCNGVNAFCPTKVERLVKVSVSERLVPLPWYFGSVWKAGVYRLTCVQRLDHTVTRFAACLLSRDLLVERLTKHWMGRFGTCWCLYCLYSDYIVYRQGIDRSCLQRL